MLNEGDEEIWCSCDGNDN